MLTHAHIGHYAGLIHLGREVMGAKSVPVHVMPRMEKFLRTHGPWSQLVELKNIELKPMRDNRPVHMNNRIKVYLGKILNSKKNICVILFYIFYHLNIKKIKPLSIRQAIAMILNH